MLNFESDYNNGAHPLVLQHLIQTNDTQSLTYGFDIWSQQAKQKIKQVCQSDNLDIYFLCGGTQTNATVIDACLRNYQAVISVDTGHIAVHEAGAIEASGHKVITLPSHDGKMDIEDLKEFFYAFDNDESKDHTAQPGMVYLTFPTELGTLYSKKEIEDIYSLCKSRKLTLFIDGARLGYGLMSENCDFDIAFLKDNCDVFYIGGTKTGALCGEAVVFCDKNKTPECFFSIIKRHGALLAKSRLTGVQFDALFTDNLYFNIAKNAIDKAKELKSILQQAGFEFYLNSPTNQQFVIIPNEKVKELEKQVIFTHWFAYDKKSTVCRFVTSWATTQKEIDELRKILLK
ncbi:MAG: aminotransferase class V-fold PLP-dependent enzyme [Bacteroidales bacterium]|nr:aminotransferase class V-fold PLP-dependent enzyme [Bacteroidales bacterium]